MNGTNAAGRRVSLLNDHDDAPSSASTVTSTHSSGWYSHRSRASSTATTPSIGPHTPILERSSSTDSSVSSPSPATPAVSLQDSHVFSPPMVSGAFYPSPRHGHSRYPSSVSCGHPPLPSIHKISHHHSESQPAYYAPVPVQASRGRASSAPKAPTKKNSYACPFAATYNCPDFFTTSGHAARHAKKHTGRKDAVCPECNKAFTRKDNMEQHRRTHLSGRGSSKPEESRGVKKSKPSSTNRRPRPPPLQPSATNDRGMMSSDLLSGKSFSGELNSLRISGFGHSRTHSGAGGLEALAYAASARPIHY